MQDICWKKYGLGIACHGISLQRRRHCPPGSDASDDREDNRRKYNYEVINVTAGLISSICIIIAGQAQISQGLHSSADLAPTNN